MLLMQAINKLSSGETYTLKGIIESEFTGSGSISHLLYIPLEYDDLKSQCLPVAGSVLLK